MTLELMPPVGTVLLGVSWPVWGSTAKVEMLLEDELATNANLAAAVGVEGVLIPPPQPMRSLRAKESRMECEIFLSDMPVPFWLRLARSCMYFGLSIGNSIRNARGCYEKEHNQVNGTIDRANATAPGANQPHQCET